MNAEELAAAKANKRTSRVLMGNMLQMQLAALDSGSDMSTLFAAKAKPASSGMAEDGSAVEGEEDPEKVKLEEGLPRYAGMLGKLTPGDDAFHNRWCSIYRRKLSYWKNADGQTSGDSPAGVIDLEDCVVSDVEEAELCWQVTHPFRPTWMFVAETQEDYDAWMPVFKAVSTPPARPKLASLQLQRARGPRKARAPKSTRKLLTNTNRGPTSTVSGTSVAADAIPDVSDDEPEPEPADEYGDDGFEADELEVPQLPPEPLPPLPPLPPAPAANLWDEPAPESGDAAEMKAWEKRVKSALKNEEKRQKALKKASDKWEKETSKAARKGKPLPPKPEIMLADEAREAEFIAYDNAVKARAEVEAKRVAIMARRASAPKRAPPAAPKAAPAPKSAPSPLLSPGSPPQQPGRSPPRGSPSRPDNPPPALASSSGETDEGAEGDSEPVEEDEGPKEIAPKKLGYKGLGVASPFVGLTPGGLGVALKPAGSGKSPRRSPKRRSPKQRSPRRSPSRAAPPPPADDKPTAAGAASAFGVSLGSRNAPKPATTPQNALANELGAALKGGGVLGKKKDKDDGKPEHMKVKLKSIAKADDNPPPPPTGANRFVTLKKTGGGASSGDPAPPPPPPEDKNRFVALKKTTTSNTSAAPPPGPPPGAPTPTASKTTKPWERPRATSAGRPKAGGAAPPGPPPGGKVLKPWEKPKGGVSAQPPGPPSGGKVLKPWEKSNNSSASAKPPGPPSGGKVLKPWEKPKAPVGGAAPPGPPPGGKVLKPWEKPKAPAGAAAPPGPPPGGPRGRTNSASRPRAGSSSRPKGGAPPPPPADDPSEMSFQDRMKAFGK